MQVTTINASGAILIGGESKRFKSDKAFIRFGDKNLSEILYHRLNKILNEVFFVSNNLNKTPVPGADIISDFKNGIGPIGGVYTALHHTKNDFCFISACDLPFLNTNLIEILWNHMQKDSDIIAPVWDGKIEPLAAFYHKRCIGAIDLALLREEAMMKGFWDQVNITLVDFRQFYTQSELRQIFLNINTPDDYKSATGIL